MKLQEVCGDELRVVVTVGPRDTISETIDLLAEHSIGAVVVTTDGAEILGIISERDIVRHMVLEQEGTLRLPVEELMTTNVATGQMDDTLESAMATMTAGHFRHLPIVAADGTLKGIVSLGDLVKARLRELEDQLRDLTLSE